MFGQECSYMNDAFPLQETFELPKDSSGPKFAATKLSFWRQQSRSGGPSYRDDSLGSWDRNVILHGRGSNPPSATFFLGGRTRPLHCRLLLWPVVWYSEMFTRVIRLWRDQLPDFDSPDGSVTLPKGDAVNERRHLERLWCTVPIGFEEFTPAPHWLVL